MNPDIPLDDFLLVTEYIRLTLRYSPLRWLLLTGVVSLFTSFSFLNSGCVLNDKNSNPVARKAWSDWQKLSDHFIARLVFPKQELYFEPNVEDLPRPRHRQLGVGKHLSDQKSCC